MKVGKIYYNKWLKPPSKSVVLYRYCIRYICMQYICAVGTVYNSWENILAFLLPDYTPEMSELKDMQKRCTNCQILILVRHVHMDITAICRNESTAIKTSCLEIVGTFCCIT